MLVEGWRNLIRNQFRIRVDGLLLALVYAVACWAARKVSLDQLYLPAGIRVAALLVCPPRMWPYLVLGEYAYYAQLRIPMIDRYGWEWVVLASSYQILTVGLIVHLHRHVIVPRGEVWLLSIGALSATAISLANVSLPYLLWPKPPSDGLTDLLGKHILGDYIAILTIAPVALLWSRRHQRNRGPWLHAPTMGAVSVLSLLGLLTALLPEAWSSTKTSIQLMMAAPVVALTCIHGWRGAAVGVRR